MIAVTLLRSMESTQPKMLYISWQLNREEEDELADNAIDALKDMGRSAIIYIAALTSIEQDQHEAAMVEGANKFQRILHIDIPHILPTATILLIMNSGHLLSVGFDKVYLMQNDQNIRHAQVISTYVYEMGLLKNQMSYSSAIGLFNSVINCTLLVCVNALSRRFNSEGASLW